MEKSTGNGLNLGSWFIESWVSENSACFLGVRISRMATRHRISAGVRQRFFLSGDLQFVQGTSCVLVAFSKGPRGHVRVADACADWLQELGKTLSLSVVCKFFSARVRVRPLFQLC